MAESSETRKQRLLFNCFPCYFATGARVTYIASDWREVKISLALNWLTRNYVGTIFGGSMFAATDPMFMIMLMKILGPAYIVWDRGASIKFLKPGKGKLYATFKIEEEDLRAIETTMATSKKMDKTFTVTLVDRDGTPHASVERILYIRHKAEQHQAS